MSVRDLAIHPPVHDSAVVNVSSGLEQMPSYPSRESVASASSSRKSMEFTFTTQSARGHAPTTSTGRRRDSAAFDHSSAGTSRQFKNSRRKNACLLGCGSSAHTADCRRRIRR